MSKCIDEPRDYVGAILDLIQEQALKVGDQLPTIRELAAMLDAKPNLIRDALMRAQTMGVVRVVPRSGAFVQSLTFAPMVDAIAKTLPQALVRQDHNLFHLLDARRLLEVELIARAARTRRLEDLLPVRRELEAMVRLAPSEPRAEYVKLDIRFHVEIARLAGNPVLFSMLNALLELLRPHLMQLPWSPERQARTNRSHTAIYDALVAGDAEKTRATMHQHLSLAYDTLLRNLKNPVLPIVPHESASTARPPALATVS